MDNQNIQRIKDRSAKFRRLLSPLIVLTPLLGLLFWACFNYLPEGFSSGLPVQVARPLPASTLFFGWLLSLIPTLIALYALIALRKLFSLYEQGIIFSSANVRCLRQLAYSLIYWVFAKVPFIALSSIVLTYTNPPGQRQLVLSFSSADLAALLIGVVVLIISWVMHEACRLEEEQLYTV